LVEHSLGKGEVISSILIIGSRNKADAGMHNTWPFWWLALRLASLAIVVGYFLLYINVARQLRARELQSTNDGMFWLVVMLALIRVFARFTPMRGLPYQFVIVLPGIAAAIGIPGLLKELTKLKAENRELGVANEDRLGHQI
jgi:hypothetical protein